MLVPWTWAAAAAACLLVTGMGLRAARRAPRGSDLAVETAIVLGLYSLWQEGGSLADNHVAGAVSHARWVWSAERAMHLPSEVQAQGLVLSHPLLVEALNGFYDIVHVPALIGFLLWLYFRHRDQYARWRTIGAILTGACLLIQMIPVAPPRLMPALGFVDTAMRYKESVYAPGGIGDATQLAAMPSVHVAWAVFVAVAVIAVSTSRWRWLVVLHPVATVFAVVATANHWWLDGIVAAALLPLSAGAYLLVMLVLQRLARRPPVVVPVPAVYALATPRSSNASAICTALSAAPLRKLSPETNMVSPQPDGSL
jgi:hypothetical protein